MGEKFSIIYADPPWQYKVYSKKGQGRSAENHYHTMNIEEIRSLPVSDIAADDCILFMDNISLSDRGIVRDGKLGISV